MNLAPYHYAPSLEQWIPECKQSAISLKRAELLFWSHHPQHEIKEALLEAVTLTSRGVREHIYIYSSKELTEVFYPRVTLTRQWWDRPVGGWHSPALPAAPEEWVRSCQPARSQHGKPGGNWRPEDPAYRIRAVGREVLFPRFKSGRGVQELRAGGVGECSVTAAIKSSRWLWFSCFRLCSARRSWSWEFS